MSTFAGKVPQRGRVRVNAGTGLTTADRHALNLAMSRHPAGKRHIRNTLATVTPIRRVLSEATASVADNEKEH